MYGTGGYAAYFGIFRSFEFSPFRQRLSAHPPQTQPLSVLIKESLLLKSTVIEWWYMHRVSLLQNQGLIQTGILFILCAALVLIHAQTAEADSAPPPDPTVGGVGPYQPQKTKVQMVAETVLIEVPESPADVADAKQIRVNASFTMQNQGEVEEQMQVIFPLTRLGYGGSMEQALYQVDISSFTVKVDGQSVPISEITTPPEITSTDIEHGFPSEVRWAAFPVTFPVKRNVILEVGYQMLNEYGEFGEGFTGIAYILETGAGWYGNILSAEISLRLPYPVAEETIKSANPGYLIAGNELRWHLKDFEPARKDNLEVKVIHADDWKNILDLRSKVHQNPNDAVAWANLGDQYFDLINMKEGYILEVDRHFTELGIEARQQAVQLSPESGEAHYKLAEILWLSNPSIINRLRMGGASTAPEPSLDDPAIQQILRELQLARSLGSTNNLPSFEQVFPELTMSISGIVTVTPTMTLASFGTSTAPPTLAPTSLPSTSPTPIATPIRSSSALSATNWVLTVLGLLIAGGIYVYRRNAKLKGSH